MGLDLGIGQFIDSLHQKSDYGQAAPANTGSGWSVVNAQQFADALPSDRSNTGGAKNDQAGALRNFLSLYALTIQDGIANNGTWEELAVRNGDAARTALFGSGDQNAQQMIQNVWIGDNKAGAQLNTYQAMHAVMARLGLNGNGMERRPRRHTPTTFTSTSGRRSGVDCQIACCQANQRVLCLDR